MTDLRYPIYIPSRGRVERNLTAALMTEYEIPFRLVVEPHEANQYADRWGQKRILVLPVSHQGITYSRNWIKDHAIQTGAQRHWQWDDNIRNVRCWDEGKRNICDTASAIRSAELWVDRYSNIGIAGLMSTAFGHQITEPFSTNQQVYCAMLIRSDKLRFRGPGEDTDYSLQVLASGDCTILFRVFQIEKSATGSMSGGNDEMYADDGRLRRAMWLQSKWGPEIVKITRRHGRVHQDLSHVWRRFTQPLELV